MPPWRWSPCRTNPKSIQRTPASLAAAGGEEKGQAKISAGECKGRVLLLPRFSHLDDDEERDKEAEAAGGHIVESGDGVELEAASLQEDLDKGEAT